MKRESRIAILFRYSIDLCAFAVETTLLSKKS